MAIQLFFKSFDLLTQSRLRSKRSFGCFGKASELGYLVETYDLLPLHYK